MPPTLLTIYSRNVDYLAFKRGWSRSTLASKLGVSTYVIGRLYKAEGRFIDADLLEALLRVFDCSPNDLLIPYPEIEYDLTTD